MALPRPPNEHEGIEPPNHTQVPNALFDLMPSMGEAELKVVLVICRQTFGWHRKEDELSLAQLRSMTGLSRTSVIKGIDEGMARGLIKRRPRGQGYLYRLKLVQNLDQSSTKSGPVRAKNPAQTSLHFGPDLVQNLDPHEDERKGKKDSGGGGAHARESNSLGEESAPLARLFTRYGITQAEPLARLYAEKWPDTTLADLTRLCETLYESDAGAHAGSRLYRKLKAGPIMPVAGETYERRSTSENRPARRGAADTSAREPVIKLAKRDW